MKSVLFVCTHHSARSRMAQPRLAAHGDGRFQAFSAGTDPGRLHPLAVEAMAEAGLDISTQLAKGLEAFAGRAFDYVVTVCDDAPEPCPVFGACTARLHWSLPDPSAAKGSKDQRLQVLREVRARLASLVNDFIKEQGHDA